MQRGIRPLHQPIAQPADEPERSSVVSAILSKLGLAREADEPETPADHGRAPASAVNTIMGRLGLAREESEPEVDEAELIRGLTDPAWAVRVATAQKLGSMSKYAPLELLLVALRDDHSSVRIAAARALSRNPRQAALHALIATLTDTEWVVRAEAVRALGRLSSPEALAALLVTAHDNDAAVRSATLLALAEMRATEALEQLNAALQDEDWSVREAAALALAQLAEPDVIPSLLNARLDQDPSVRSAAEAGLQQIYPDITAAPPPPSDSFAQWLQRIEAASQTESPQSDLQASQARQTDETIASIHSISPITPTLETAPEHSLHHVAKQRTGLPRGAGQVGWSREKIKELKLAWLMGRGKGFTLMHLVESLVAVLVFASLIVAWAILANRPDIVPVRQSAPSAFTIYREHTSSVEKLAWSPDGRSMASADNRGTVLIWQVSSGRTLAKYTQAGRILALTWSDASTLLVAYGVPNQSLQIQEISTGTAPLVQTIFQRFSLPGTPDAAAWDPSGSTLAFDAGNGQIQLWAVNAQAHQYLLTLPGTPLSQVVWSPDGQQIATIPLHGLLQIWNPVTGEPIATLPNEQQISSAAWTSCGKDGSGLIAVHAQNTLLEWCPGAKGKITSSFLSPKEYNLKASSNLKMGAIAISPNGAQILMATSDGLVQARDAVSGKLVYVYADHSAQVNAFSWSPNGRSIATAGMDTTVQIWQET